MKILLVEDDVEAQTYVRWGLAQEGHTVDVASTVADARSLSTSYTYDLFIVDRMIHGEDGLNLVRELRAGGCKARIIFLTALGGIDDRVDGLDAGGDDYLRKPFAFAELRARIDALGRRPNSELPGTLLQLGEIKLDLAARTAERAGQKLDLPGKEFQLLAYLMRNRGRVVTRTMLLEQVWDIDFDPGTNVVESHISKLRAKIDKPFDKPMLKTIRGAGYVIDAV